MANRSMNKATLIGNLTRDPELKYTPKGTAVCTFGLATNRTWTTATGETKEDVQFHKIVAWQKLAELCGQLLTKGRKMYLEGRIVYRTYVGKDEVQRNTTEIIMNDFILFDDKGRTSSTEHASVTPADSESVKEETHS
ncbi:MAG: single-stranded DNA-binding protein, partial [Candidatus Roizmanbacteria bacterium]